MTRQSAALLAILLAGGCQTPGADPTFGDIQAEQQAIQRALGDDAKGAPLAWRGPDGASGMVTVTGVGFDPECRTARIDGPTGRIDDVYCPTKHGFWVHPEELFYRQATGRETYGGTLRSGGDPGSTGHPGAAADRPTSRDCLKLYREQKDAEQDGRAGRARALGRELHRCLHARP